MEFDETDFEETGTLEDEVYTIETAKETAETSQLTTSEQEERQTFVITGKYRILPPANPDQDLFAPNIYTHIYVPKF